MSKQANRFTSTRRPSARELRGRITFAAWQEPRDEASVRLSPVTAPAEKTSAHGDAKRRSLPSFPNALARTSEGRVTRMPAMMTYTFFGARGRTMRRVDVLTH